MTQSIPVDPATLLARVYMALLFAPSRLANIAGLTRLSGSIGSHSLPLQEFSPTLALVVELVLAILLLLGFKTRWAALGLAVFAAVVTLSVHALLNMPKGQRMPQQQLLSGNAAVPDGVSFAARAAREKSNCPTSTADECFGLVASQGRC